MPGLTGLSATLSNEDLGTSRAAMERALYPVGGQCVRALDRPGFSCRARGRAAALGTAERGDVCLAVEGLVRDTTATADALAEWFLDRVAKLGERFVDGVRGSFQVVVRRGEETWLVADPVASRRLFYARARHGIAFSPEVAPVVAAVGRGMLDAVNLVQFLATGRFFAGETALAEVRALRPGEILVENGGRLRSRRHFLYEIASEPSLDAREACTDLEQRIEQSILDAWRNARRPALMLSGGYDSRFLLYTVARSLEDTSELRTISWGASPERPGSDARIALGIAEELGTRHRHWQPRVAESARDVDRLFTAQSGMTDCTFTHVEELDHHAALRREGFGAVLRGDEIFGPLAPEVRTVDEALSVLGLCRRCPPALEAYFADDGEARLAAHAARCERWLGDLPADPAALRDTLYVRERSPSFLQQLNYHRGHDLEVLNPLVDLDVLRLWGELPAAERLGKRAFRRIFERRFGTHLDRHPIATRGNGLDWTRVLRDRPALAASLRADLEALPAPLSATRALADLDAVLDDRPEPGDGPPLVRRLFRAWVLGRWIERWAHR